MFHVIRGIYGLPGKEQIPLVVRTTFGTTVAGSVGITTYTSGLEADDLVRKNHERTLELCDNVLNNPKSTEMERNIAVELKMKAETARNDWFFNGGSNSSIRGVNVLLGDAQTKHLRTKCHDLNYHTLKLNEANQLTGSLREQKLAALAKELGHPHLKLSSPLEPFFSIF